MKKEKFGCCSSKITLPRTEYKRWIEKGWLGNNGVCEFPERDQAFPSGLVTVNLPPGFWQSSDDTTIENCIATGLILFKDGNGDALTKEQYMKKYPGYPAPDLILRLQHRLPPGSQGFIEVKGA